MEVVGGSGVGMERVLPRPASGILGVVVGLMLLGNPIPGGNPLTILLATSSSSAASSRP